MGRAGGAMKREPAGWLAPFCGRVASVLGRLAGGLRPSQRSPAGLSSVTQGGAPGARSRHVVWS